MKKATINKDLKVYLYYDETDVQETKFAKAYLKFKRNRSPLPKEIKKIEASTGFVGSGEWKYEMDGREFTVTGHANGRGFWGTDYSIR